MTIDWKLFKKITVLFIVICSTSFLISCIIKLNVNDFLSLADSNNKLGLPSSSQTKFVQYVINNGLRIPFQMF